MPGCVVGHKFWFEPVPTDVEVHDGLLYVTELFGGQVSTIKDGVAKRVKAFLQPAAIEWDRGRLIVSGGLAGPAYVDVFRP